MASSTGPPAEPARWFKVLFASFKTAHRCTDAAVVFRAATSETIDRLRRAADGTDRELDAALSDLGILPPADLEPIRRCLVDRSAVIVAGTNRDGHRRLEIRDRWGTVAWIDHDGEVALVRGHQIAS